MTVASGMLSTPIALLRGMLAACPSFQAWVGAADATAARARIHLVTSDRNPVTPFAIVDFGDLNRDRTAVTNKTTFEHRDGATVVLYLRSDVPDGTADEDALLDFTNAVGAIWTELEKASGNVAAGALSIRAIELSSPPTRNVPEQRDRSGDYFETVLSLTYSSSYLREGAA